jgi:potassium channel subfamily K, other eukaryote
MNDPGLDQPIDQADSQVHDVYGKDSGNDVDMDEEDEELNYLMPARWWYASTAIPLTAGTFGPMANAFSICALVQNWRVRIPPGGTEEHGVDIKDPKWSVSYSNTRCSR